MGKKASTLKKDFWLYFQQEVPMTYRLRGAQYNAYNIFKFFIFFKNHLFFYFNFSIMPYFVLVFHINPPIKYKVFSCNVARCEKVQSLNTFLRNCKS